MKKSKKANTKSWSVSVSSDPSVAFGSMKSEESHG
jgi:hypothetical protein